MPLQLPAWFSVDERPSAFKSSDQSKGHRHCSIGHEDSHVKSWPWPELTLASYRPAHGEDQGHGRTTIGATVDRDLPFKTADDRLDKL